MKISPLFGFAEKGDYLHIMAQALEHKIAGTLVDPREKRAVQMLDRVFGKAAKGGGAADSTLKENLGDGIIREKRQEFSKYVDKPILKKDNQSVREWYVANVENIPNKIDKKASLKKQVQQAYDLRNKYKCEARKAMFDRATANMLEKERPVKSFEELLKYKMVHKGLTEEEALKDILKTASKTNKNVNKKFDI